MAKVYDASGDVIGSEFVVNTETANSQYAAHVTALDDGGFFVAWTSYGQDGDLDGIYGQRYAYNGNKVGSEVLLNDTTTGEQYLPAVETLANGDLIISWQNQTNQIIAKRVEAVEIGLIGQLDGTTENDVIFSTSANDILIAGNGNDVYRFDLGDGQDIINNQDFVGFDRIQFGVGIEAYQLWFSQDGYDLIVNVLGTSDQITLNGWFISESQKVDEFVLHDNTLLKSFDVSELLDAMAGVDPSFLSDVSQLEDLPSSVTSVILNVWNQFAKDDFVSVLINGEVDIDVLSNDSNIYSSTIELNEFTQPLNGTVILNVDGTLKYQANSNFHGIDFFDYTIIDPQTGSLSSATVIVTVNTDPTVSAMATVTGYANDGNMALGIIESTDADGDNLSYRVKSLPDASNGNVILGTGVAVSTGQVLTATELEGLMFAPTFNVNTNFGGELIFEYEVLDGYSTVTGQASINITALNVPATLIGGSLNDLIQGGSGNDTVEGQDGNDVLYGGDGVDILRGGNGNDLHYAGLGNDKVGGKNGDDVIHGDEGDDMLWGDAGQDILYGDAGNDQLEGGSGDDIYRFGWSDGQDIIRNRDTAGIDKLEFGANIERQDVWLSQSSNHLIVKLLGSSDQVKFENWYSGVSEQVDTIELADGYVLQASAVDQLVSAMASFDPNFFGSVDSLADLPTSVQTEIAATWQNN